MPVSRRLRFEILRRDDFTCGYCGRKAPQVALTVDHLVPTALGGSDDPSNLLAACDECNSGKSSVHPDAPKVAEVQEVADRWDHAMKAAAAFQAEQHDRERVIVEAFRDTWRNGAYLPDGWESSIVAMSRRGLSESDMARLVHVALTRRHVGSRFRYFCGCVWNFLSEREAIASALMERPVELLDVSDPIAVFASAWDDCVHRTGKNPPKHDAEITVRYVVGEGTPIGRVPQCLWAAFDDYSNTPDENVMANFQHYAVGEWPIERQVLDIKDTWHQFFASDPPEWESEAVQQELADLIRRGAHPELVGPGFSEARFAGGTEVEIWEAGVQEMRIDVKYAEAG